MAELLSWRAAEPVADVELHAYNAAFYELGLRWHWDAETFRRLQSIPLRRDRVRIYLETHQSHLLKAYDAEFLADAIESKRSQFQKEMRESGLNCRPHFNWVNARMNELGH